MTKKSNGNSAPNLDALRRDLVAVLEDPLFGFQVWELLNKAKSARADAIRREITEAVVAGYGRKEGTK